MGWFRGCLMRGDGFYGEGRGKESLGWWIMVFVFVFVSEEYVWVALRGR